MLYVNVESDLGEFNIEICRLWVKQIALQNVMGLTQSVEGLTLTKRLTSPSKREFSNRLPLDFICTISSPRCPPPGLWTGLLSQLSWALRLLADTADYELVSSHNHVSQFLIYNKYMHILLVLVLWRTLIQVGTLVIAILNMRKLRLSNIQWLAQSHMTKKWPSQEGTLTIWL